MLKFAVGPIPAALHNTMLHQAAARWIRIHYQHSNNRRRRTTTPAGCLRLLLPAGCLRLLLPAAAALLQTQSVERGS